MGGDVHKKKKDRALVVTTGREVNAEKSKYMAMSSDQHAGQNPNIECYKFF